MGRDRRIRLSILAVAGFVLMVSGAVEMPPSRHALGQDQELVAESVAEALVEIVADHFDVPLAVVHENTSFVGDLGATDVDLAALRTAINEEFGIALTDGDLAGAKTIERTRDLVIERLP